MAAFGALLRPALRLPGASALRLVSSPALGVADNYKNNRPTRNWKTFRFLIGEHQEMNIIYLKTICYCQ